MVLNPPDVTPLPDSHGEERGSRECPRICVGMSEQEPHVFNNNEEVSRSSEGL
jgi:hypothetical protein